MFIIKAIYPNGSHSITDPHGKRLYFATKEEAEKAIPLINSGHQMIVVQEPV
jgi:hypothetical protein